MEKSYITNSFMQNMGDVLAECEVRLAPGQADRVGTLVKICVVFWDKNMTVRT